MATQEDDEETFFNENEESPLEKDVNASFFFHLFFWG